MILTDPSGNLPFIVGAALIGMIGGAIAGGLTEAIKSYAKKKDISWKEVGKSAIKGAAIGGAVAITGGVALSYAATGSAVASTGAVMSGLGLGVAASMGAGGASGLTGFQQVRQSLQAQQASGSGAATSAQKLTENVDKALKFGENDLVYGIYSSDSIVQLQKNAGGKFLSDFTLPHNMSWLEYSKQMIDKTVAEGNKIRFNLTGMDTYKSLMGIGEYARSITTLELRYIQENWSRLSEGVRFYQKGAEVLAPWLR